MIALDTSAAPARSGRLCAFPWYGGKASHLKWLLPLLPAAHHYVEPYGGSAAVLLNREPSPVETYNDLDGDAVNFFRVLREQRSNLLDALRFTPYSRGEFALAIAEREPHDPVERARRFFVRARQVRAGKAQERFVSNWKYSVAGKTGVTSWRGGIDQLDAVVARLLRVQLEQQPAVQVIQRYDAPGTLFYVDPPYDRAARTQNAYRHEMAVPDHECLAAVLHAASGLVAVSGYRSPLYDRLYADWQRTDVEVRAPAGGSNTRRIESLWTNYDPAGVPA